jgi:hypothetical protein
MKQSLSLFAVFSLTLACPGVWKAKWIPERLWEPILACSRLWWPNVSQKDSGSSFWLVLGSVGQMASREVLGAHFGLFWALVAKCLPERFWGLILGSSGFC